MKKIRVFAACQLGASISFFAEKLIEAAKEYDVDLEVKDRNIDEAHGTDFANSGCDVILIAPQVRFHGRRIRQQVDGKIPVVDIDGLTFATMDGKWGFETLILPYIKDKLKESD